jgi:CMP/dCMP kinase
VFPDAELKVYLVADPAERARRRLREHGVADPKDHEVAAEAARLQGRDEVDSTREVAPLACAPDAVTLDTTGLAFSAQVLEIVRLARARGG